MGASVLMQSGNVARVVHRLIIPHPECESVLVEMDGQQLRLPGFTSDDRHTAEVDYINAAVRERLGLVTTVLRSLRHDLDPRSGAVTRVHELEVHGGAMLPTDGALWRDVGELVLPRDEAAMVSEWRAGTGRPPVDGRDWTRAGWFAEARDWIERTLTGTAVAGAIDVVQLRAWQSSCVLRARTPAGDYYCKALAESGRREYAVAAFLAERFGTAVPALVACDPERRWLLMRGCPGPKLEDVSDAAAWERAAAMYARLQVGCVPHVGALRARGCPQRSLADLAAAIAPLASDDAALRRGESDGLSVAEVDRLRALVPELGQRCAALGSAPIPLTLEHGDLWPGNFLVDGERCVLIDWEDVAIGHPFFSLAPLLVGLATYQPGLDTDAMRQRLQQAYLTPFTSLASPRQLRTALQLAVPLSFVDMAIRYRRQPPSVVRMHPWMRDLVPQTLRLALAEIG